MNVPYTFTWDERDLLLRVDTIAGHVICVQGMSYHDAWNQAYKMMTGGAIKYTEILWSPHGH